MAEYEVIATLEQDADVDIDFSNYKRERKLKLISTIINGGVWTFESVPIILEGETIVEIEPPGY